MKKSIALVFAASTLVLAGCCTAHHTAKWEYQTRDSLSDAGLNKLASEGWIVDKVLTFGGASGNTTYLLKRHIQ